MVILVDRVIEGITCDGYNENSGHKEQLRIWKQLACRGIKDVVRDILGN